MANNTQKNGGFDKIIKILALLVVAYFVICFLQDGSTPVEVLEDVLDGVSVPSFELDAPPEMTLADLEHTLSQIMEDEPETDLLESEGWTETETTLPESDPYEESSAPADPDPVITSPVHVIDLSAVPEEHRDHLSLANKDRGGCRSFTGQVAIHVFFVNDGESTWNEADKERTKALLEENFQRIRDGAANYGVNMVPTLVYRDTYCASTIAMGGDRDGELEAIRNAGYEEYNTNRTLAQEQGADEAPIVFLLNKTGRAYSHPSSNDFMEYSVVMREGVDYAHELCHLFGAVDYYVHEGYAAAAREHLPDSIMNTGGTGLEIDPLTAYLIGWTDTLHEQAIAFLQATSSITQEDLKQAATYNYQSGYVENFRLSNGSVYTGYLENGLPHGYGRRDYPNGWYYEGEWDQNRYHGQGTRTYTDGGSYTGSWNRGDREGYGVCTYPNGDRYEGEWADNHRNGYGIYYFNNGEVREGYWANSEYVGSQP